MKNLTASNLVDKTDRFNLNIAGLTFIDQTPPGKWWEFVDGQVEPVTEYTVEQWRAEIARKWGVDVEQVSIEKVES